jgi:hypothetical protein
LRHFAFAWAILHEIAVPATQEVSSHTVLMDRALAVSSPEWHQLLLITKIIKGLLLSTLQGWCPVRCPKSEVIISDMVPGKSPTDITIRWLCIVRPPVEHSVEVSESQSDFSQTVLSAETFSEYDFVPIIDPIIVTLNNIRLGALQRAPRLTSTNPLDIALERL